MTTPLEIKKDPNAGSDFAFVQLEILAKSKA